MNYPYNIYSDIEHEPYKPKFTGMMEFIMTDDEVQIQMDKHRRWWK